LEDILFGNAWKEVSVYEHLMKQELWDTEKIPIIPEKDLDCITLKVGDNVCASGFLLSEVKIYK
jgi:hypothetical protein